MYFKLKLSPTVKKFKGQHSATGAVQIVEVNNSFWKIAFPLILGQTVLNNEAYTMLNQDIDIDHFDNFIELNNESKQFSYK
ncbi:hypothetical protein HK100_001540, partial [Physocladia obscura]